MEDPDDDDKHSNNEVATVEALISFADSKLQKTGATVCACIAECRKMLIDHCSKDGRIPTVLPRSACSSLEFDPDSLSPLVNPEAYQPFGKKGLGSTPPEARAMTTNEVGGRSSSCTQHGAGVTEDTDDAEGLTWTINSMTLSQPEDDTYEQPESQTQATSASEDDLREFGSAFRQAFGATMRHRHFTHLAEAIKLSLEFESYGDETALLDINWAEHDRRLAEDLAIEALFDVKGRDPYGFGRRLFEANANAIDVSRSSLILLLQNSYKADPITHVRVTVDGF